MQIFLRLTCNVGLKPHRLYHWAVLPKWRAAVPEHRDWPGKLFTTPTLTLSRSTTSQQVLNQMILTDAPVHKSSLGTATSADFGLFRGPCICCDKYRVITVSMCCRVLNAHLCSRTQLTITASSISIRIRRKPHTTHG